MPTYEYVCESCHGTVEMWQRISDEPAVLCPHCDQESLKRQISGASFALKGGGWASDGYTSSSSNDSESAGTKETK